MENDVLKDIIDKHSRWIKGEKGYSRADLSRADLSRADLGGANLWKANLMGANLWKANLSRANLSRADLSEADLSGANLSGANLWGADLRGATFWETNLWGADLRLANISGADLRGANLKEATLWEADLKGCRNIPKYVCSQLTTCPEEGSFIGWKKIYNTYIVKLQITENAKRSSATTRKCRCSEALVLDIQDLEGNSLDMSQVMNYVYNNITLYKKGEMIYPDSFDEDRWNECSNGIHFFITRDEAVSY